MRQDYTHINFVLDRSGSMLRPRNDTVGGFNSFLSEQKAQPGYATLSLRLFADSSFPAIHELRPLSEVPALSHADYLPDGWTALWDAIGQSIHDTGELLLCLPEAQRPSKVIFAIMTDGEENASSVFSGAQIADMIKHQTDIYKWQFVFLGANQNAILKAREINIAPQTSMTFAANAAGTQSAYRGFSEQVSMVRSGVAQNFRWSGEDRADQTAAGVHASMNVVPPEEADKSLSGND